MREMLKRLRAEEDGIALTEYLILLGLMVGGVVLSMSLFATALAEAWTGSMRVLTFTSGTTQGDPSGAGGSSGTNGGDGASGGSSGSSGSSGNGGNSGSNGGGNGNGNGNGNGGGNGRGRN